MQLFNAIAGKKHKKIKRNLSNTMGSIFILLTLIYYVMLSLINNLGEVSWKYNNGKDYITKTVTIADASKATGQEIKSYSKSISQLQELVDFLHLYSKFVRKISIIYDKIIYDRNSQSGIGSDTKEYLMRILVIEDNKDLCDAMCFQLKNEGYVVDCCYTGEDALYYAMQESYDVIILDRMLPVMDGLTILKKLRQKKSNVPVIMVTAMDGLHDRIDGLDSGADDYIVKPFEMEELIARIRAIIRRPPKITQTEVLARLNLELDLNEQVLRAGEQTCTLSKRETDLMELFLRNQGQIIVRERILSYVWGPDHIVESGNLDNYIYFLRRRLRSIASGVQIKTVHGVGYRLE